MFSSCNSALQSFPSISGKPSLMDNYDYVMYGKIFKYKDNSSAGHARVEVFISYGGLLMQLIGELVKDGYLTFAAREFPMNR